MKQCNKCFEDKEDTSFSTNGVNTKARKRTCNACREKARRFKNQSWEFGRNLKKKYSISIETYQYMDEDQKGVCLICKKHKDDIGRKLFVDHCHTTLKVRGLLCSKCNTVLGMSDDSIEVLENAIAYLKKSLL